MKQSHEMLKRMIKLEAWPVMPQVYVGQRSDDSYFIALRKGWNIEKDDWEPDAEGDFVPFPRAWIDSFTEVFIKELLALHEDLLLDSGDHTGLFMVTGLLVLFSKPETLG